MSGPFYSGSVFSGGFFGAARTTTDNDDNDKIRKQQEKNLLQIVMAIAPVAFEHFNRSRK